MSQVSKILTLGKMVELLKAQSFTTKDQLLKSYSTEYGIISERTLQRDLKKLRDEFYIEVSYSRSQKGYFIEEDSYSYIDTLLQFSSIVRTTQVMERVVSAGDAQVDILDVTEYGDAKGAYWIEDCIEAVTQQKNINIDYHPFGKETMSYDMSPWLVKFSKGRWYVFGYVSEKGERVLAMDRIQKMEMSKTKYRAPTKDPKSIFKNSLGVWYSDRVEEVVIRYHSSIVPYQETLPLHESQKWVASHENGDVTFSYQLNVNQDLINALMVWAGDITVISPPELKEKILAVAEKIQKNNL